MIRVRRIAVFLFLAAAAQAVRAEPPQLAAPTPIVPTPAVPTPIVPAPTVPTPTVPTPVVPPPPDEPSPQGTYNDWSLYSFAENGNPVCYLASRLQQSTESRPRRAGAYVLITNRPAEGRKGVVSVIPGYTYQPASAVLLTIGRKQFHLFTDGGTAWAKDDDDPLVVQAIHGGSTLVVTGHAKDGTASTDTFSLKGAAPALAALDQACPMPGEPTPPVHHRRRKRRK